MTPAARWVLAKPADREALLKTMAEFEVSPPLAQVILSRGFRAQHLGILLAGRQSAARADDGAHPHQSQR